MTLQELYIKKKEEYDKYLHEKTIYDTKMSTYIENIKKSEETLKSKINSFDKDIQDKIYELVPSLNESIETKEDALKHMNEWKNVYAYLEQKGFELLNGGT